MTEADRGEESPSPALIGGREKVREAVKRAVTRAIDEHVGDAGATPISYFREGYGGFDLDAGIADAVLAALAQPSEAGGLEANLSLSNADLLAQALSYPALPSQEHGPAQGLGEVLTAAQAELRLWRMLVTEGGVPRYTVTPGAALNNVVTSTDALLKRMGRALDAALANPATPEPSGMGRLGRNETSSAGEGEKLREALQPFATAAESFDWPDGSAPLPDSYKIQTDWTGYTITLGDLRRAREVLDLLDPEGALPPAPAQPAVVPGGEGER